MEPSDLSRLWSLLREQLVEQNQRLIAEVEGAWDEISGTADVMLEAFRVQATPQSGQRTLESLNSLLEILGIGY